MVLGSILDTKEDMTLRAGIRAFKGFVRGTTTSSRVTAFKLKRLGNGTQMIETSLELWRLVTVPLRKMAAIMISAKRNRYFPGHRKGTRKLNNNHGNMKMNWDHTACAGARDPNHRSGLCARGLAIVQRPIVIRSGFGDTMTVGL